MFDKIADRRNEEERQERRLERRFSVFFVVLMKRVLSAAVLAAVLFGMAAWGNWAALESREEKEQTAGEILEQEEIAMLIREVILVKGEDLRSLKPETEVLDDRVCLRLSDGTERVAINVFEAQDMAKGGLNGDGIVDLAFTGLDETVNSEVDDGRKVYPFLGQAGGAFRH